MEDEEEGNHRNKCDESASKNPVSRQFDDSTMIYSAKQSRPPSQRSDSLVQVSKADERASAAAPAQVNSPETDRDGGSLQSFHPADHGSPAPSENSSHLGRRSKRLATPTSGQGAKKARAEPKPEDVERLLSNSNAGLYKADFDLKSVLLHNTTSHILRNNNTPFSYLPSQELNSSIASFKEDGRAGRHDPEWARQALNASARRAAGDFDSFEAKKFQETWAEDDPELSDSDEKSEAEDPSLDRHHPSFNDSRRPDDHEDGGSAGSGYGRPSGTTQHTSTTNNNGDQSAPPGAPSSNGAATEGVGSTLDFSLVRLAPKWQITYITGDGKFDALFRPCAFVAQPVIQAGDVIRLRDSNMAKDVIFVAFHSCRSAPRIMSKNPSPFGNLDVAIPPRSFNESEPHLRDDIVFPNERHPACITGLTQIFQAMKAVEPGIDTSKEGAWENYEVYRDGVFLGTVFDLRQAWHFAKNEYDFKCQLNFQGGRQRRLHKSQQHDGYMLFPNSGLYRKVLAAEAGLQNGWLIIDLGGDLIRLLAACADEGFTILMYDFRILVNDGIPVPKGVSLRDAYERGPDAFTTSYTRDVAASAGWTKGYAHIGPLGLGKGWKGPQWSKGRARPGAPNERHSNGLSKEWLDLHKIRLEDCPHGCEWTPREISAVGKFHETHVVGKVRHHPLPKTKLSAYVTVMPGPPNFTEGERATSYVGIYELPTKAPQIAPSELAPQPITPPSRSRSTDNAEQAQLYVSPYTSVAPKSNSPYVDLSSLPPGDARVAMADLFQRDHRRLSSARMSSADAVSSYYSCVSSAAGNILDYPVASYHLLQRSEILNYPPQVRAGFVPVELEERRQQYPASLYLANDGDVVRTNVEESVAPERDGQVSNEFLEISMFPHPLGAGHPVNDTEEAAQRWHYKNVDNPYSLYPEIPSEYLLRQDGPKERPQVTPYYVTPQDYDYNIFSFDDLSVVPGPPIPFRSAFGSFDGSCDERVSPLTNTYVTNDSQVSLTVPSTLCIASIEVKVDCEAIKLQTPSIVFIKSDELEDHSHPTNTQLQTPVFKPQTRSQPFRRCKVNNIASSKTEDSQFLLPAAKLPRLSGITSFIERGYLAASRFRPPTEMARYKRSKCLSAGSPSAGSCNVVHVPDCSLASPPNLSSTAPYNTPHPSALTCPAAPRTPCSNAPSSPFVRYGSIASLNICPLTQPMTPPMSLQNPGPHVSDADLVGFAPDGTFYDNSAYTSPYRSARGTRALLPAGAYLAVEAFKSLQRDPKPNNSPTSVAFYGPFDLLNGVYPKIGNPIITSSCNGRMATPPATDCRDDWLKGEITAFTPQLSMAMTSKPETKPQNYVISPNFENMSLTTSTENFAIVDQKYKPVTGTDHLSSAPNPPLEYKSSHAVYFDRHRHPESIRIPKFTTNESSPASSVYPDPEGFLSLPHYPHIMYPISSTPFALAALTDPSNTELRVTNSVLIKRKFHLIREENDEDYFSEGEEFLLDTSTPLHRK